MTGMFDIVRFGVFYGGLQIIGKLFAKIAFAIGGTFVLKHYVLTPIYDMIMNAIAASSVGNNMYEWLTLSRIPDAITVIFAAYGVRGAQKLVFQRLIGGSA